MARRVKPSWVPTPLPTVHAPIRIVVPEPPSSRRTWQIVGVVLGWLWRVMTRRSAVDIGLFLKHRFEALGGVWIKVGQFLSMRFDLFSEDFCHTLSHLQARAPGFSSVQARAILEQQLKRPLDAVFDEFDSAPRHAASLGQVYRAKLRREQTWVAVKVRTPFAVDAFLADLHSLAVLAWLSQWIAPRFKFQTALIEFRRVILEELDFRFEANGMRRMRKTLRPHDLYVPKCFTAYCTDRVLVAEWIDGVLMADYLDLSPGEASQWCALNCVRPKKLSRILILSLLRQVFEDNRFHGDLHPGNIILLKKNRFALLDFGMTSSTEQEFLTRFRDAIGAISMRQFAWAADLCCMLSSSLPAKYWWVFEAFHARRVQRLKTELIRQMQDWTVRTEIASLEYHQKSLNAITIAIQQTLMESKASMQWAWLRIQRTFSTLDTSLATLDPTVDYRRTLRTYFKEAAKRQRECPLTVAHRLLYRLPDLEALIDVTSEYVRLQGAQKRQHAFPV